MVVVAVVVVVVVIAVVFLIKPMNLHHLLSLSNPPDRTILLLSSYCVLCLHFLVLSFSVLLAYFFIFSLLFSIRYEGSVDNTVEENSSVFSLI